MAEFVECRMEEMIQEFEQMEKLRLFDKNEIRSIAKKRKEFEYKIQKQTKSKDDFLRYIQYEMDVLRLVRMRKEEAGLAKKKADLEYIIANRVNRLFKEAIFKFKKDVRLWVSYIKFCRQMRFNSSLSPMLHSMLSIHGDKPQLWSFAAAYEYQDNKSVENARQFLLRGLRAHPTSKLLYTEAFSLELQYAVMKQKELQEKKEAESTQAATPEANSSGTGNAATPDAPTPMETDSRLTDAASDQVIDGRTAEVLYDSAVKKIHDIHFMINLLTIAKKYNFTHSLQKKIVDNLMTTFPNDELTWDTMARRELEGLSYSDIISEPEQSASAEQNASEDTDSPETSEEKKSKKQRLKERIRRCCGVYNAAVKQLPSNQMWSLYLETMLELYQDKTHLPTFKKKILREGFQGAHSANKMEEKYYHVWVEMLKEAGKLKKLEAVLKTATQRLSSSVALWSMRLQLHLERDEERTALTVFQEARAALGNSNPDALTLWKMMLLFYQTKFANKVEQLFQEGIKQGVAVSNPLKPMYIEWLVLAKGIPAARKAYESMCDQPPFCVELHNKMVALEMMQPDVNMKHIRRIHELACEQFGKSNTDVWLEYVKFEQKSGDAKKVSDIYWRAVKNLDSSKADSFVSEFSLVKTGLSIPHIAAPSRI